MPYPQAKPDDPVHLKTFDPHTFYPAIAARHISGSRQDSVSTFPSRSICEPEIPENFDPATFYPALAAREKLKLREGSVDADSIYPSSSISQPTLPRSERPRLRYSYVLRFLFPTLEVGRLSSTYDVPSFSHFCVPKKYMGQEMLIRRSQRPRAPPPKSILPPTAVDHRNLILRLDDHHRARLRLARGAQLLHRPEAYLSLNLAGRGEERAEGTTNAYISWQCHIYTVRGV